MIRYVTVYGTLKNGHGNHGLLNGSNFIGNTIVEGKMFSLGGFPGVRLDEPGTFHAEVYEVDEETLAKLDILEGVPHLYTREIVIVTTHDGCILNSYIYQYNGPSNEHVMENWK